MLLDGVGMKVSHSTHVLSQDPESLAETNKPYVLTDVSLKSLLCMRDVSFLTERMHNEQPAPGTGYVTGPHLRGPQNR